MKFYMTPGSCSTGIHILLEEIGLVFEAYIVNLVKGDHLKPDYLAINPNGTIPTLLRDDGVALTDFHSIALWLAEAYPRRKLLPEDADAREAALGAMHGHRGTVPLAVTPSTMAAHWPPLLVIHGNVDPVVSPKNGEAAAQVWAQAAGARASQPRPVRRGQRYPMSVTDFKRKGSTVASLVEVSGLAHAWSGGATSQAFSDGKGPDASRMAWAFAAKQFRSAA